MRPVVAHVPDLTWSRVVKIVLDDVNKRQVIIYFNAEIAGGSHNIRLDEF